MPRQVRIEYKNAIYHITAKGNRGALLFLDERDRAIFLETLSELVEQLAWNVLGWALLEDNYHLVVETPEGDLVKGMTWFQNTVTKRLNGRHKQSGHLFAGRYKALLVERKALDETLDYVHFSPIRAGLVSFSDLENFKWGSFREYLLEGKERAGFSALSRGLELMKRTDTKKGRKDVSARSEKRLETHEDRYRRKVRGGLVVGSEKFLEKTVKQLNVTKEEISSGFNKAERRKHREEVALKVINKALKKYKLQRKDLPRLPKNDWRKVEMALEVRAATTVNSDWLGDVLKMGSRGHISNSIRRYRELGAEAKVMSKPKKAQKKPSKKISERARLAAKTREDVELPSHLL